MTTLVLDMPEAVVSHATEGRLSKDALANLLTAQARVPFFDACSAIELRRTEACAKDPCLESGCSAEGERCLQPLIRAAAAYYKACGVEWAKLFADTANRDPSWRVTASSYDLS